MQSEYTYTITSIHPVLSDASVFAVPLGPSVWMGMYVEPVDGPDLGHTSLEMMVKSYLQTNYSKSGGIH